MVWLCGFIAWCFMVATILGFFHVACSLDDDDPVDFQPERSEIDSWPR